LPAAREGLRIFSSIGGRGPERPAPKWPDRSGETRALGTALDVGTLIRRQGGPAVSAAEPSSNELVTSPAKPLSLDAFQALRDVEVEVALEIGRQRVKISDVLRLGVGQTIELTKAVGEPVDIYVNGQVLGRGKAIVVNNRYGVRITELLAPMERA
jgi:flagellar motor switch protein FliN/FliY